MWGGEPRPPLPKVSSLFNSSIWPCYWCLLLVLVGPGYTCQLAWMTTGPTLRSTSECAARIPSGVRCWRRPLRLQVSPCYFVRQPTFHCLWFLVAQLATLRVTLSAIDCALGAGKEVMFVATLDLPGAGYLQFQARRDVSVSLVSDVNSGSTNYLWCFLYSVTIYRIGPTRVPSRPLS